MVAHLLRRATEELHADGRNLPEEGSRLTTIIEDRQRDSTPGNRRDGSEEALATVVITEE